MTTQGANQQQPYSPERYPTISAAWNAPLPKAAEITTALGTGIAVVAAFATPFLMMHYLFGREIAVENINKSFHKPAQFFLPPIVVGMIVGMTLAGARDLSYRVSHVIQTGAYQGYNRIKQA